MCMRARVASECCRRRRRGPVSLPKAMIVRIAALVCNSFRLDDPVGKIFTDLAFEVWLSYEPGYI